MQFYTKRRRMPVINVVSLIDVFCLLLIFFIVTTTFKKEEPKIQIKVPESATAAKDPQAQDQEPVIIYATKAQEIYIGEQKIPISGLADALKSRKAQAKNGFSLKADTDVPLGFFVKVMDAAKEAGISGLSMYTEDPKKNLTAPAAP